MAEARLILICGLPGSGKTMFARQLVRERHAIRLCPDEWKHDLGIDYYDEQRRVQLENRLWRLAQELLALGQSVIMENGFGHARRGTNSDSLRGLLARQWNCTISKCRSKSSGGALRFVMIKARRARRLSSERIFRSGQSSSKLPTRPSSLSSMMRLGENARTARFSPAGVRPRVTGWTNGAR